MFDQARQTQPPPLPKSSAVAAPRSGPADLEAALLLGLLVLAGLVWMIVGAAVMRGAQGGARAAASLQRGLADLQALRAD